jgi:hypothetical protein
LRSQAVSTVQTDGLKGRVLAADSSAALQARSTAKAQLGGLESKLVEQAAVIDKLYAQFERLQRTTTERLQVLEELLEQALATNIEKNSS